MLRVFISAGVIAVLILGGVAVLGQSRESTRYEIEKRAEKSVARTNEHRYGFYNLYAAFAVRNNDLSICEKSDSPKECLRRAKSFYDLSQVAKGNCDWFKSDIERDTCTAVNEKCQAAESETARLICEAYKRGSARKISKATYRPDWAFQVFPLSEMEAEVALGVYHGFKSGKVSSCVNQLGDNYRPITSGICKILFSPQFTASDFFAVTGNIIGFYKDQFLTRQPPEATP